MGLKDRELPASFAAGMDYFNNVLLPDETWFQAHEGEYVAVLENKVRAVTSEPMFLAKIMEERFPDSVVYMPHVVKLSPSSPVNGNILPSHWLEAEQYYKQILRNDPEWLKTHIGSFVAIIGRQVVDEANVFYKLSDRVRETYGYGAIFMPEVSKEYPRVIQVRSPIRIAGPLRPVQSG